MKDLLKNTLFILLNFIVLVYGYIPLQCIFTGPWTLSVWSVVLLVLFFLPYSIVAFRQPTVKQMGVVFFVFVTIILITTNSDSIQLASDKDMCWDFGGRWNYEFNKCEHSNTNSLNK